MEERTTGTLPTDRQTGTLPIDRQTGTLPMDRQTGTLPIERQIGTLSIDKPENELNHTLRKTEYSIKTDNSYQKEMRTLTKAWIQKAWPYMITCQLQGCSQPGMPVQFAMVTLPKAHFMLFSKPVRLMEIRMRIG